MDDSPKKFDRTLAILTQLQSKKIVRAQELAERFGVSLRTIYRDMRSLEASGVPLYGEAGTGYSLVDGYKLPPVMFTREEAASFIAAEKLVQKFTDKALGGSYNSAMYKIKSILKNTDKDWLQHIEENVLMQQTTTLAPDPVSNVLAELLKSIASKCCITLHYQAIDAENVSERLIEPVGVFHDYSNWYVIGFCHLRNDYRQFRTDRIFNLGHTQQAFTRQHQPLEFYLKKDEKQFETTKVRMVVDPKFARYLSTEKYYHGFISETVTNDGIEMLFMARDIKQWFPRWYMMYADFATILEPQELIDTVTQLIEDYSNKLIKKHPESY
jgi:predicted DNA-binding transcriptional regulator YafY